MNKEFWCLTDVSQTSSLRLYRPSLWELKPWFRGNADSSKSPEPYAWPVTGHLGAFVSGPDDPTVLSLAEYLARFRKRDARESDDSFE